MTKRVAIIGAGFTGLAAGCYARLNGYDVDIFEQHSAPGGLCAAWERGGYTFDLCLHWLYGSDPSSIMGGVWAELGVLDGQEFIDPEVFAVSEGWYGGRLVLYSDPERLRAEMKRVSPGDARTIDQFCGAVNSFRGREVLPLKAPELVTWRDWLAMARWAPDLLRLWRWSRWTVQDFRRRFRDPFLGWALCAPVDLDGMPLAAQLMVHAWLADRNAGYAIGGSLALVRALERRARELGCRIHYQHRVDKVLVDGNHVVGLRVRGLEADQTADWVIAAGDLHTLLNDLLDGRYTDAEHQSWFETFRPFPALAVVSFGVRRAFDELPRAISGTTLRLPRPTGLGGSRQEVLHYRVHHFDPTLAPTGSTAVTCSLVVDYDHWRELSEDRQVYLEAKRQLAEGCATILDQRFPGFRDDIEVTDVATPVTLERYTSNWRGSFEGWMIDRKNLFRRCQRTLDGLDRLYLAGQWVQPGGGLPTAALQGRTVVEVLCHRDGVRFTGGAGAA